MLIGEIAVLRPLERRDLPLLQEWANDQSLTNLLGSWHFPVSTDEHGRWFDANVNDFLNRRFAIEVDGQLIGSANLVSINWKDRNAFHGMMIGDPTFRSRGIGPDVVNTVMQFAFLELGLHRLDSTMISSNTPSIKMYTEKCGWEIEGTKPEWFFRNGNWHDLVIVGITKRRYLEFQENKK